MAVVFVGGVAVLCISSSSAAGGAVVCLSWGRGCTCPGTVGIGVFLLVCRWCTRGVVRIASAVVGAPDGDGSAGTLCLWLSVFLCVL